MNLIYKINTPIRVISILSILILISQSSFAMSTSQGVSVNSATSQDTKKEKLDHRDEINALQLEVESLMKDLTEAQKLQPVKYVVHSVDSETEGDSTNTKSPDASLSFKTVEVGKASVTPSNVSTLKDALEIWGNKEEWSLVWEKDVPPINVPSDLVLDRGYKKMIESVKQLVPANSSVQIMMFEGDRVIYVHR